MRFANPTLLQGTGQYVTEYQAEVPGSVTKYEVPGWLSQRLRKHCPVPRNPSAWMRLGDVLRLCGDSMPAWLDHAGTATVEGKTVFVSEPYGLTDRELTALIKFASMLGIRFQIGAASHHFPTQTLRITFWPPDVLPHRIRSSDWVHRQDEQPEKFSGSQEVCS